MKHLLQAVREADLILLTHGDMEHLGALPYLAAQGALQQKTIFATHPVARLGQMVMFDQHIAQQAASDFTLFELDHVDAAFGQIRTLKYHQLHRLKGAHGCEECTQADIRMCTCTALPKSCLTPGWCAELRELLGRAAASTQHQLVTLVR